MDVALDQPGAYQAAAGVVDFPRGAKRLADRRDPAALDRDIHEAVAQAVGEAGVSDDQIHKWPPLWLQSGSAVFRIDDARGRCKATNFLPPTGRTGTSGWRSIAAT